MIVILDAGAMIAYLQDEPGAGVVAEPDETGVIVAGCPSLPGSVSQGITEVGAIENVLEAIKRMLGISQANNMPMASASVKTFLSAGWTRDRQVGSHV